MKNDPIVEEVRRTREKLFAEFNYDLAAFGRHLQERTEVAKKAGRKVVPLPPRPADSKAKNA